MPIVHPYTFRNEHMSFSTDATPETAGQPFTIPKLIDSATPKVASTSDLPFLTENVEFDGPVRPFDDDGRGADENTPFHFDGTNEDTCVPSYNVNGNTGAAGQPVTVTFAVTPSLGSPEEGPDGTSTVTASLGSPEEGRDGTSTVTTSLGSPEERPDGTSNTLIYAEKFQLEDSAYVLTAIEHAGVNTLQTGSIGGVTVASGDVDGATDTFEFDFCDGGTAGQPDLGTGAWIPDTTYETGAHLPYQDLLVPSAETTGPTVAMETLTIGHEGFLL